MSGRSQQIDMEGQPQPQQDIKLHQTENAWKPSVAIQGTSPADPEKKKTEVSFIRCFIRIAILFDFVM